MLTLFETTSGEGWTVTMFNAADAVGTDVAPVRDRTPVATWVFPHFYRSVELLLVQYVHRYRHRQLFEDFDDVA